MSTTNEQIKFKKGQLDNIPTAKDAGTLFFAQDNTHSKSGRLYLDVNNSTRVQVSGVGYDLSGQEVVTYNDGTESASVIAGESAEIFNDYRARTNGSSDKTGNVATGEYSTASGLATTAEGSAAFAVGSGTTASGEASFAGGKNSLVNGNFAAGFGKNTQVSGDGSFGIGDGTRAIGDHSFAGGQSADYITLQVTKNLGNNQYQITNLDGKSNYLDDSNNLTDLGKLSIGSVVFQINTENNGRGSIAIVENKEKNENDECIITLKNQDPTLLSWTFTPGPFQFVPGGSYGKNSFSFGENCTAAGENSISGGNGVSVWGPNAIGWGSVEDLNFEEEKKSCQEKIDYYTQLISELGDSIYDLLKKGWYMQFRKTFQDKLIKLNSYNEYLGVGDNSAVFGKNNSSLGKNSLVAGYFNVSKGDNSLVVGEGNIANYPNMAIFGSFSKMLQPDPTSEFLGVTYYNYLPQTGSATHSKSENYFKPQLLVGNGGTFESPDSNSFEVYNNGLVIAQQGFRVVKSSNEASTNTENLDMGEIGYLLDHQADGTSCLGFRIASFNKQLFLDSENYICPPPSKTGLLDLGTSFAKWNNIYAKKYSSTETLEGDVKEKYFSIETRKFDIKDSNGNITTTYYYPTLVGTGSTNNNVMMLDCPALNNAMRVVPNPNRTVGNFIGHGDFDDLRWGIFSKGIDNKGNIKNTGSVSIGTTLSVASSYNNGNLDSTKGVIGSLHPNKNLAGNLGWDKARYRDLYVGRDSDGAGGVYSTGDIRAQDGAKIRLKRELSTVAGGSDSLTNFQCSLSSTEEIISHSGLGFNIQWTKSGDSRTNYSLFFSRWNTTDACIAATYEGFDEDTIDSHVYLGCNKRYWKGVYSQVYNVPNGSFAGNYTFGNTNHTGIQLKTSGSVICFDSTTYVCPSSAKAGALFLGGASSKWKDIYSTKSGLNTDSDIRIKDIQDEIILQKLLKIYEELTPIAYKFKGSNHDRTHVGLSSQEVELKLLENGLTALDFGGFCKDPVYKIDENGHTTEEIVDYMYGMRYSEFHGLHMMKNHQQDARLAELEAKNKELENTISNLKTQMELLKLAVGG